MSVITRKECPEHGNDTGLVRTGRGGTTCGHAISAYRNCDKVLVEVEYVPASQLAGAVEDRDALAAYVAWRWNPIGDAPIDLDDLAELMARLGYTILGGSR